MKFKSTKKVSEIILEGVKVELDTVDGSLKSVVLTDSKGSVVRIAHRDYSSIYVEVPAPPETEKKYKLTGSVLGLPVDQTFDDEFSAREEKRRLEGACVNESETDLKVEHVAVPVAA